MQAVVTLFLVMDPLGNIPLFLSVLKTVPETRRRRVVLRERGRLGVARWVMRDKEYVGALRADGGYLLLITLRHAGEVVPPSALDAPGGRALDKREIAMAKQLIAAMEDELDIASFKDEYRERVLELVEAKAAGKVVKFPRARAKKTDKSLADVLEKSLAAAKKKERKSA